MSNCGLQPSGSFLLELRVGIRCSRSELKNREIEHGWTGYTGCREGKVLSCTSCPSMSDSTRKIAGNDPLAAPRNPETPLPPPASAPIIQWHDHFSGRTKNENESDGVEIAGTN